MTAGVLVGRHGGSRKAGSKRIEEASSTARGSLNRTRRAPTAAPPFTIADIRASVPPELFERSAFWSFCYLLRDLAAIVLAFACGAALYINGPLLPLWLRGALWPIYTYIAGCLFTGVWVIAHEVSTTTHTAT
jgi:omega-6 fatty acid desaturase (delta-12 desaturase)